MCDWHFSCWFNFAQHLSNPSKCSKYVCIIVANDYDDDYYDEDNDDDDGDHDNDYHDDDHDHDHDDDDGSGGGGVVVGGGGGGDNSGDGDGDGDDDGNSFVWSKPVQANNPMILKHSH